ncbi:hypothetical protein PC128_g5530 [Phytophthora cactorum]|nr:hypothetical protein PC120_g3406 [Phytophthora cactorum]KAG3199087.1 hypothetical protein PC128_g5530 [Phytophthora cactorum]
MRRAKNVSSSRCPFPCRAINAVRELKLTDPAKSDLLLAPDVVSPGELGGSGR